MGSSLKSDLLTLLILTALALGSGLMVNQYRQNPLPVLYQSKAERLKESVRKIQQHTSIPSGNSSSMVFTELSLEAFATFVEPKQGIILDARPALFYRLGHVPGALSLPREDFDAGYTTLKGKLEANRAQPIVIYCSDAECEDSRLVRESLKKLGYTNLSLFEEGWSAWSEAKKPVEVSR